MAKKKAMILALLMYIHKKHAILRTSIILMYCNDLLKSQSRTEEESGKKQLYVGEKK